MSATGIAEPVDVLENHHLRLTPRTLFLPSDELCLWPFVEGLDRGAVVTLALLLIDGCRPKACSFFQ
jgi:hypothetical protein